MKKTILIVLFSLICSGVTFAQTEKPKLYHPEADASADIMAAITKAKAEGKHVLLQIGGNWCSWCIAFDKKVKETESLKTLLDENYIAYHLNYSQENLNEDILADLGYPQRFGFPVFVVLDGNGKRIHTQNSVYLEEGKGHDEKKIAEFFKHWGPKAIAPESYPSRKRSKE
jgi:thioredoxin-related protein